MNLVPKLPPHAIPTIHSFLRAHSGGGKGGVVVALSGGIDSALAARLARDALGADHVMGVLLPDQAYPVALRGEVEDYARSIGISFQTIPIDAPEQEIRRLQPEIVDRVSWGNVKARLRMILVYNVARVRGFRVMGTGNKSELLLGYFTKYGDGGCDLAPLGDLYKTELRELSRMLGLPKEILERPPTAGLWEGQTDEAELGATYDTIDRILRGLEELRTPEEIVTATGLAPDLVQSVLRRVEENRHKRRLPPIPKLSLRTIGIDWRE